VVSAGRLETSEAATIHAVEIAYARGAPATKRPAVEAGRRWIRCVSDA